MQGATVAVAILLVSGVIYSTILKHVTLVVNGRAPQAVSTTSSDVRDLLTGEGISLTSGVLVTPSPGTRLADGMTVVVGGDGGGPFSNLTTVSSDLTGVGVWVVAGTSAVSVSPDARRLAESSGSASSAGTSPVVSVRAVVSGKVHDVSTNAGTTGALLSAMGITPDADDRVQPSLSTPLHDGSIVSFDRVEVLTRLEPVTIPYRVITTFSPSMVPGTQRVLTPGRDGDGRATYRVTLVNGVQTNKRLIARWIERAPVAERVVSGPESMYGGSTDVPGGVGNTQVGLASWYDPPWSGLTAAHPTLPFGTRVTVTDLDTGRSVTVVIDDRGPFARGKIIDLSPEAFAVLAPLGTGVRHVQLSW
jgi:Lytic transglycolase/G5 domain/G5-linked-Ubiquitin-like domain